MIVYGEFDVVMNPLNWSEFFNVSETEVDRALTSRRLLIELDELGCISEMSYYDYVRADDSPNYVELE